MPLVYHTQSGEFIKWSADVVMLQCTHRVGKAQTLSGSQNHHAIFLSLNANFPYSPASVRFLNSVQAYLYT